MRIRRLGIVGAGTMGAGIAALAASAGVPVVLLDIPAKEGDPNTPARKGLIGAAHGGSVAGARGLLGGPAFERKPQDGGAAPDRHEGPDGPDGGPREVALCKRGRAS